MTYGRAAARDGAMNKGITIPLQHNMQMLALHNAHYTLYTI